MNFTIFGGAGFIGNQLINYLRQQGHNVHAPLREDISDTRKPLGHVIYAIGLTGDFRSRPYDTVEAHVCLLAKLLKTCSFDSWLYLSSTRVYASLPRGAIANEQSIISLVPCADTLYDLSKMLGESLCLAHPSPYVRIARLSNVFGIGQSKHTFLASVLQELKNSNSVTIYESQDSCKDYVAIDDVLPLLQSIATCGKRRIYNVASGNLTAHASLAEKLVSITGAMIVFSSNASNRVFPQIDINAIVAEFQFSPSMLLDQLNVLLSNPQKKTYQGNTL